MAVRQRFSPAERAAFVPGAVIEWLHGSRWVPATVTVGPHRNAVTDSWQLTARYDGKTTATISNGARIDPGPGQVRLTAEQG